MHQTSQKPRLPLAKNSDAVGIGSSLYMVPRKKQAGTNECDEATIPWNQLRSAVITPDRGGDIGSKNVIYAMVVTIDQQRLCISSKIRWKN